MSDSTSWGFIKHIDYAEDPSHYIRALFLITEDLRSLFEYVEPSDEGREAFSYRIHALLMRTCIEIEANFKAILFSNIYTAPKNRSMNINDFRKVDVTHHLSSYEVTLPMWNGICPIIRPFEPWYAYRGQQVSSGASLAWYQAYNQSKHNRHADFRKANLWALIEAVAGLIVIISSQFLNFRFDSSDSAMYWDSEGLYPFVYATGDLFLIKYPEDWIESEKYDFDWSVVEGQPDPFEKIDYDKIVS